ncbi:MAG TPA: PD-(D/E)XK nuclease family protein [Thermoanaerobaculia bacterium]|nr:PD-(D/E)XK nuclease family protein [Thermoanaerobaculia bacterium]
MERNRLLSGLADFCAAHPLDEKILLVPSFPVGTQVLDALARSGCAHLNLRPATVFSLAHGVAGPALAAEGRETLSRAQLLALVEDACDRVLEPTSYFGALRERPGLHRALQSTLNEIRRAGLTPERLPSEALEDPRKAREMKAIGRAYRDALEAGKLADPLDVLAAATRMLGENPGLKLAKGVRVLRPEGLELSALESAFLEALLPRPATTLAVDAPEDASLTPDRVFLACASGEENEVRAVFRRVVDDRIALDDVEIAITHDAAYRPLVYELAQQAGFPCTFADGIPATFSRPAQGVLDVLDWIAGSYQERPLARLLGAGRANLGAAHPRGALVGPLRAARAFRRAGIVRGRERTRARLALDRARLARRAAAEGLEPAAIAERLVPLDAVAAFVDRLLAILPVPDVEGRVDFAALARAGLALTDLLDVASRLDGMAREGLARLFAEFAALPPRRLPLAEAAARLREAVSTLAVASSTPLPGHAHVARIASAGWCGRGHTFVLGLDEARFPGGGAQDPVLLDHEREAVNRKLGSPSLPLRRGTAAEENRRALASLLARARGRLVLSYSNRDFLQDAEQFPSSAVLDVFRVLEGRPRATFRDLFDREGAPAAFRPAGEPLDEIEWWLAALHAPGTDAARAAREVEAAYPWIADGREAEEARRSSAFTKWDGRLSVAPGELDPRVTREPTSASRLQLLAKSPRAYFLKYVLGLSEPDEERAADVWLDPLEYGRLFHDTVFDFFTEREDPDVPFELVRETARLFKLADRNLGRMRGEIPPPSEVAFRQQRDAFLADLDVFVKGEAKSAATSVPRFFEVPFGRSHGSAGKDLASAAPLEIAVASGSIFLEGKIDRIDSEGAGAWAVWDYKTGSERQFRDAMPLNRGRQIQHALYARAAAILLRRSGFDVESLRSGYYFPTRKGGGRRVVPEVSHADVDATLADLLDLLAAGAFPHSTQKRDCEYCDFRMACGDPDLAARRSKAKCESGEPLLEALRALEGRNV